MSIRSRVWLSLLLITGVVGVDRAAKMIARAVLAFQRPTDYLGGLVRLEFVQNHGAFLGLGGDLPSTLRFIVLVVISGALVPVTLWLALRSRRTGAAQVAGLALIAGGGTGNLIDRIFNDGAVVDFVSMGAGPLRTGIFNIADLAITTGLAILVILTFRKPSPAAEHL